ncbi:hypothetical protein KPH14_007556 [Odynerus spinipes]|uniref:Uncharacterized protein n=1 Tax=Odynerus spinipes TaxID=1348599 RepID=A0AAD9VN21_9HYME|nr:hypothetical protein KPH14_007556 [Odynerus spinipes]
MSSSHQEAAIRRLEELFRDVKLEQQAKNPELLKVETKIDRCCDVHGKHAKENCWNRRSSVGSVHQTRRDSLSRRDGSSPSRRGSLGLPMSPPKRELHPSGFPNTLRKNPLGASTGAINHSRRDSHFNTIGGGPNLRRDPIGRSMGCLKKDTALNYNSPLRRDYVAKSMTSLPRTGQRRNSTQNLSSLFASESRTSPKGELAPSKTRSASSGNLKSCLAGSNGNLRSHLNVTLNHDPLLGSNGISRKDGKTTSTATIPIPLTSRRGSFDRRRFSTDSLDNSKRNSWDPGRRGSSGSSGGWDDPIWEEGTFPQDTDQVTPLFDRVQRIVANKLAKVSYL